MRSLLAAFAFFIGSTAFAFPGQPKNVTLHTFDGDLQILLPNIVRAEAKDCTDSPLGKVTAGYLGDGALSFDPATHFLKIGSDTYTLTYVMQNAGCRTTEELKSSSFADIIFADPHGFRLVITYDNVDDDGHWITDPSLAFRFFLQPPGEFELVDKGRGTNLMSVTVGDVY